MDTMLEHGKKRKRLFFPDGIPGVEGLSKAEVNNDIATLSYYDHELPSLPPAPQTRHNPSSRLPKRTRLAHKIQQGSSIFSKLNSSQKSLRKHLEDLREESTLLSLEVARYSLEIGQFEKTVPLRKQQLQGLQDQFTRQQQLFADELVTQQTAVEALQKNIFELASKTSEEQTTVSNLQTLKADVLQFDRRFRSLQYEYQQQQLKLSASEQLLGSSTPSQGENQGETHSDNQEIYAKLSIDSETLKNSQLANAELERSVLQLQQELDQVKTENQSLAREAEKAGLERERIEKESQGLSGLNEALKAQVVELTTERDSLADKTSELDELCEAERELYASFQVKVDASEERALAAEKSCALFQRQYSTVVCACKEMESKYVVLQGLVGELESVKVKSEAESSKLRKESILQSTEVSGLRAEVLGLQSYLKDQNREVQMLVGKLEEREERCRLLVEEKNELEGALAQSHVGRISEAIGYLDEHQKAGIVLKAE